MGTNSANKTTMPLDLKRHKNKIIIISKYDNINDDGDDDMYFGGKT